MGNAKVWYFRRKKQVGQSGHQIVKINDNIGVEFFYLLSDKENAFNVRPNFEQIINNARPNIGLFIFGSGKKIRAVEEGYFGAEFLSEKRRKFPTVTLSN
jgi:hypothetical protein